MGKVAAQVPGQNTSLHERHLPYAQVLLKHWVIERLPLPLLVSLDNQLAPLLSKLEGSPPLFP